MAQQKPIKNAPMKDYKKFINNWLNDLETNVACEMEDVINFEILIRHNDEMEAKTLFNKALKTHP